MVVENMTIDLVDSQDIMPRNGLLGYKKKYYNRDNTCDRSF